jgi:hypothetical protein
MLTKITEVTNIQNILTAKKGINAALKLLYIRMEERFKNLITPVVKVITNQSKKYANMKN